MKSRLIPRQQKAPSHASPCSSEITENWVKWKINVPVGLIMGHISLYMCVEKPVWFSRPHLSASPKQQIFSFLFFQQKWENSSVLHRYPPHPPTPHHGAIGLWVLLAALLQRDSSTLQAASCMGVPSVEWERCLGTQYCQHQRRDRGF